MIAVTKYAKLIKVGAVVAVLAVSAYGGWTIKRLVEENNQLEAEREKLTSQIVQLEDNIERQKQALSRLEEGNRQAGTEYREAVDRINTLRQPERTQPESIKETEIEINSIMDEFNARLRCSTGDESRCAQ